MSNPIPHLREEIRLAEIALAEGDQQAAGRIRKAREAIDLEESADRGRAALQARSDQQAADARLAQARSRLDEIARELPEEHAAKEEIASQVAGHIEAAILAGRAIPDHPRLAHFRDLYREKSRLQKETGSFVASHPTPSISELVKSALRRRFDAHHDRARLDDLVDGIIPRFS